MYSLLYLNLRNHFKQPNGDHFTDMFIILLYAFQKHYNCRSLLLKLIEDIISALNKGYKTGAVFMDLSKVFDCLTHALLIAQMIAYSLFTAACEQMCSYLNQMEQRVNIKNCRNSWKIMNKGKPQCSILGPLLFNVFMNDMFLSWTHVICIMTLMITPW